MTKTKIKLLILFFATIGFLHVPESFSDELIPSCNAGIFVSDDIQCYIQDDPPCPKPSFEKDNLCVVKKSDLCKGESVLANGECMIDLKNFRIDDPTFTRQNLLIGNNTVFDPKPSDFRETGDSVGMLYAYSSLCLVGIVLGFFVIKKWKNRT